MIRKHTTTHRRPTHGNTKKNHRTPTATTIRKTTKVKLSHPIKMTVKPDRTPSNAHQNKDQTQNPNIDI